MTDQAKQRPVRRYTIEQFMDTERLRGNSITSDNRHALYSSDKSGVLNVYSVPIEGGTPEQLTHSEDEATLLVSCFPEDERFLFMNDRGGNERYHLYVVEPDGTEHDLTPGDDVRALFQAWSIDGGRFVYGSNRRDPKFMDSYELDAATLESKLVFRNESAFECTAVSPDLRQFGLLKMVSANDTDMYLYRRGDEQPALLTPHEGDIEYVAQAFNRDGTALYYLTNEGSEFRYLVRLDLESGKTRVVHREEWDIVAAVPSPQYTYLALYVNVDGRTEVKLYHIDDEEFVELPEFEEGQLTSVSFSEDESLMSFMLESSVSPANLYVHELGTGKTTRLTNTLSPQVDPADLARAEVVRYKSFDGLEIPGILYRARTAPGAGKPALIWVHGGPGGQSRVRYDPLIQYLVNHGYTILAANNRGSSGYGKTFFQAADRKHGELDLADIVAAKGYMISAGLADADQVGIIGGSYGGYMVLAALAFKPQVFDVGVDIFGVANWVRTLKSIPSWWEATRDRLYTKIGNPYEDEEYLASISPLFHAGNIIKPLIVLQGANDPRVLKVESDEVVEAVRENGVPVEYVVFDDEGHGFTGKDNQIHGYKAVLEFLDEHLKILGDS